MPVKIDNAYRILLFAVLLLAIYFSSFVIIISMIGVGIGVLISPALDHLQKILKIKRGFCALLLLLAIAIFILAIMAMFGWVIIEQAQMLADRAPEITNQFRGQLDNVSRRFPWLNTQIQKYDYAATAQVIVQYVLHGLQSSVTAVGGMVFAIIIGLYLSIESTYYFEGTVRIFPPAHRPKAFELMSKCARVLRIWFQAQLVTMAIIGLITTIGLYLVGVSYWALFGVLTALLGIIPYVGIMIVVTIVSLIAFASDPSLVPWVLLVFFVTQQIEGNVVLPLVMRGQAEIPEALLIIVMLFFGFWFGLIGVFIAPPLVAVAICIYRNLYLPKIES